MWPPPSILQRLLLLVAVVKDTGATLTPWRFEWNVASNLAASARPERCFQRFCVISPAPGLSPAAKTPCQGSHGDLPQCNHGISQLASRDSTDCNSACEAEWPSQPHTFCPTPTHRPSNSRDQPVGVMISKVQSWIFSKHAEQNKKRGQVTSFTHPRKWKSWYRTSTFEKCIWMSYQHPTLLIRKGGLVVSMALRGIGRHDGLQPRGCLTHDDDWIWLATNYDGQW